MLKKIVLPVIFFSASVLVSLFCLLFFIDRGAPLLRSGVYTLLLLLMLFLIRTLYKMQHKKDHRWWRYLRHARWYTDPEEWLRGARLCRQQYSRHNLSGWYIVTGEKASCHAVMSEMVTMPTFCDATAETRRGQWVFFPRVVFWLLPVSCCVSGGKREKHWRCFPVWSRRLPAPAGVLLCLPATWLLQGEESVLRHTLTRWQKGLACIPECAGRRLPVHIVITGCDMIPGFSQWVQSLRPEDREQTLGGVLRPDGATGMAGAVTALFDALACRVTASLPGIWPSGVDDNRACSLLGLPQQIRCLSVPVSAALSRTDRAQPDRYRSLWLVSGHVAPFTDGVTRQDFLRGLIEYHLPVAGRPQKHGHPAGLLAAYGMAGMLIISASLIHPLLRRNIAASPPQEIVSQLIRTERSEGQGWKYGVFYPLLLLQHTQGERALLTLMQPVQPDEMNARLLHYRDRFRQSAPGMQREMILALARCIHLWQMMVAQQPLALLLSRPALPAELHPGGLPLVVSPRLHIAVQNSWVHQHPEQAKRHIAVLQDALSALTESDPHLAWLLAPSSGLVPFRATEAGFPLALPETVPGVWTQAGQQQMDAWLLQIISALGTVQRSPTLREFTFHRTDLQQDAWFRLLLAMTAHHFDTGDPVNWRLQLDAIVHRKGWATRFAQRVTEELQAIPDNRAHPWLKLLRQLSATGSPGNRHLRAARTQLVRWLKLPVREETETRLDPARRAAWADWQADLQAVALMVSREPLRGIRLTEGLSGAPGTAVSPFTALFSRFEQFRLSPGTSPPADVVWQLYLSEARFLLAGTLFHAACELQQQWQTKVLWPNQLTAANERAGFLRQAVPAFIQTSTVPFLDIQQGLAVPVAEQGYTLPFTREFLHFVKVFLRPEDVLQEVASVHQARRESQRARQQEAHERLSRTPVISKVTSLPATVPSGGEVLPTGTRLILQCGDETQVLSSLNFKESRAMAWRPGECDAVELTVQFPGFDAITRYEGEQSWPDFLRDFARGEHLFQVQDFETGQEALKQSGVHAVLVRYWIAGANKVKDVWRAWSSPEGGDVLSASGNDDNRTEWISQLPPVIAQCPWKIREKDPQ
ncbi:hypothetical protein CTW67_004668 [Salmonella enterica subsp. enterica serovar Sandiego]|nr:hypothetical protein [Salmonella enterica subsp. enterica serovar Sandiego]